MKDLCAELEGTWHREIPISKAMGIHIASFSDERLAVRAALAPNVNVHGTAFAGSLYAVAALAGWGSTWLALKTRELAGSIVIADGHIRYERPVDRDIVATCLFDADAHRDALARLSRDGKTRFPLVCTIAADGGAADGAVAARFEGDYAVRLDRR